MLCDQSQPVNMINRKKVTVTEVMWMAVLQNAHENEKRKKINTLKFRYDR